MATFPQTKESVLRQLSESEESAAKLILGVSPAQARWQAEPGKSVEHLAVSRPPGVDQSDLHRGNYADRCQRRVNARHGGGRDFAGLVWTLVHFTIGTAGAQAHQDSSSDETTARRQSGASAARVYSVARGSARSAEALGQSGFQSGEISKPICIGVEVYRWNGTPYY